MDSQPYQFSQGQIETHQQHHTAFETKKQPNPTDIHFQTLQTNLHQVEPQQQQAKNTPKTGGNITKETFNPNDLKIDQLKKQMQESSLNSMYFKTPNQASIEK